MPDPVNPTPIPAANPAPAPGANTTTTTGLPSNVAAALACIPLIGGLVFYILEKHDQFVRFYAMQSIIFGGVWCLFNLASSILHVIFAVIPLPGWVLAVFWLCVPVLAHFRLFAHIVLRLVILF